MADPRGVFIAFEGGEGAGKSTQVNALAEVLTARGCRVVVTREPGGSPGAEAIRELVLDDVMTGSTPWSEAMLFAAARADHVATIIQPALDRGEVVLCDRFVDSSIAYQGGARGLGMAEVRAVNNYATGGLLPDLTVLLDLDPSIGLRRVDGANRMEAEAVDFHVRVRRAFAELAGQSPDRYLVLDASQSTESVVQQVESAVLQLPSMQAVLGLVAMRSPGIRERPR